MYVCMKKTDFWFPDLDSCIQDTDYADWLEDVKNTL